MNEPALHDWLSNFIVQQGGVAGTVHLREGDLLVLAAAAALAWVAVARNAASWAWAEREADLFVRHGIWVRRLEVVPYGRMQLVEVTAGPLQRRAGIATVTLRTAAPGSDARIVGVPDAEASRLRDRLTARGEAQAAGL